MFISRFDLDASPHPRLREIARDRITDSGAFGRERGWIVRVDHALKLPASIGRVARVQNRREVRPAAHRAQVAQGRLSGLL